MTARATVVNIGRCDGYDVFIGRPGFWGNPFSDGTRLENVARHREHVLSDAALMDRIRAELAGKRLGCHCAPAACHGDVLARIANGERNLSVLRGECRLLVTGGSWWDDPAPIRAVLEDIRPVVLIEGGQVKKRVRRAEGGAVWVVYYGADHLAKEEARKLRIPVETYPADWGAHGRKAGGIRNQEMLDKGRPTLVYAFPTKETRGTWDMVRRARAAGVEVRIHES